MWSGSRLFIYFFIYFCRFDSLKSCTAVVVDEPTTALELTTLPRRLPLQELAHFSPQVRRKSFLVWLYYKKTRCGLDQLSMLRLCFL
jgi:hypothetical protein